MQNDEVFNSLTHYALEHYPDIQLKQFDPADVIFEERVKMSCFYCARYNVCWRCPPKIPKIDYPKVFREFENAAFIWVDMPFTKETYADVRTESSVRLHHAILELEKVLLNQHSDIYL